MFRSRIAGLLASLVMMMAAVVPARAAEEARPPQPYVLLIGISEYADKDIKPRPHAEDDVKALYDLFTNKDYLGVDKDHIRLLLGKPDPNRPSQPATRANILKAIHWLATEPGINDLTILAFIGQGAAYGERSDRIGYLAVDSTVKDRAKNAVAAVDIGHELDKLKSQRFVAFIDVNFKGYTIGNEPAPEPSLGQTPYKEFLGSDGSEEGAPAPGRVVFLATNGLSTSHDLKDHGLFAQVLLDGLKGAADKEGYEPDGVVTVEELTTYVNKELPEQARRLITAKTDKIQEHFVLGGRSHHFPLTSNPAVASKVQERLDKLAQLARENKLDSQIAEEGQQLLSRMPRLEAQRSLRREYQKLVEGQLSVEKFLESRARILESMKLRRSDALAYARKVMQAIQMVRDNYVKEVNAGEMVSWGVRDLYRRLDEKLPPDIQERLGKVKQMKDADLAVLLADVRERLGSREDLAGGKDVDLTLQRMLSHLDPYTTYIDKETLDRFKTEYTGGFTGIGIQIRKDAATDMLQVVTPIKGSPAYKAGLQAGDLISKITREVDSNGKKLDPVEVLPTKGLPLSDAVKKILGKEGTKVKLTIEREGVKDPIEFEITRGRVEVETVMGVKRKANDDWDFLLDPDNKIGYIRLTQFSRNTARDVAEAMRELQKIGLKGLVLDLRFNPGGLLQSATRISDMFIDDGLIVTIKPRVGRPDIYLGEREGSHLEFPMVCLVNGGSASGSEIVAAALQDHKRAIIVGERTYGKGSVQNIQPFEGGEMKMTIASFWRPSGKNLNKSSTSGKEDEDWGVIPDRGFEVKLSPKERADLEEYLRNAEIIRRKDLPSPETKGEFKDRQLEVALDYLRSQIKTASRIPAKKAG
ncbi:MAG TPA: S41 family peptidase [Gemmataceae bacterium]|nr:S41 family peptidase [Gemmataceae bacterium]